MRTLLLLPVLVAAAAAADFPQVEISSGEVHARVYLPDSAAGYYRATRFDWGGVIPSLTYKGIEYFGQWFPRYDPKLHDSIVGPVESFDPAWYEQAKPGGTFLRVGVGLLKRETDKPVDNFHTYEIADGGRWNAHASKDRVEITHDLAGVYLYKKTVRVEKDELILEHSLKNTGKELIETDVYNHGFYMIAGKSSGPDFTVQFPFEPRTTQDMKGITQIQGKQLSYTREFRPRESVYAVLDGFSESARDYDIRVENRAAKAGVRVTSDHGISKLHFWSIDTTVCPEPYTHIKVEPGKELHWRVELQFYTM